MIRRNVAELRRLAPSQARFYAVVKADAYGHGAVQVARAAIEAGAQGLAVATLDEARELSGLLAPDRILVMGPILPGEQAEAIAGGFALTCSTAKQARWLVEAAGAARLVSPAPVHVKVDSGMTRYGALPAEVNEILELISASRLLALAGLWTHLASAESDPEYSRRQLESLESVAQPGRDLVRHALNTAGLLRHPEMVLEGLRVGIGLYGCEDTRQNPGAQVGSDGGANGTHPAMALRARVGQVKRIPVGTSVGYGRTWVAQRPSRIATVTIGYADGIHRARSNRGAVLVRGRRAPLVGRISMDSLSADVTDIDGVIEGDVVTIFGADGDERITAEDVAGWSGTISYEVLTSVGRRVRRVYSG